METQTLEFWVEMLCRRWAVALQVGLLAYGLVATASMLLPPTYVSSAKILVESNRAQLLVSPSLQQEVSNQPSALSNPVTEQDLNSEVELLGSSYLVHQALIGIPEHPSGSRVAVGIKYLQSLLSLPEAGYGAIHGVRGMTPREAWVKKIENNLSTYVIKRSNVIEVSFRSHNPEWTADFLIRLLSRYLELHARISNDPQAEKFFEAQRRLLEDRLNRAEDKLRGAQLQTGITEVTAQEQALINELYAAETDYRKTSASLDAANELIANLQAQLARTPQRQNKEYKVVQNMALQQIKPQVLQLETEHAELLSRYQPTSARIHEIDAKLDAARKILDREDHREVQETTTDINPTWAALDSDLAKARSDGASFKATQATEAKQLEALNKQLKNLASDGLEIQRLQLQVDSDKQAFLSYVRKGEEARAANALNRSRILNVTVVEEPAMPVEPTFPKVTLNLVAGLLLAMVFATGAAFWAETRDPRICSKAAITQLTGLPTVTVLNDRL